MGAKAVAGGQSEAGGKAAMDQGLAEIMREQGPEGEALSWGTEKPPKPHTLLQHTPISPWGQLSGFLVLATKQYYLVFSKISMATLYYF